MLIFSDPGLFWKILGCFYMPSVCQLNWCVRSPVWLSLSLSLWEGTRIEGDTKILNCGHFWITTPHFLVFALTNFSRGFFWCKNCPKRPPVGRDRAFVVFKVLSNYMWHTRPWLDGWSLGQWGRGKAKKVNSIKPVLLFSWGGEGLSNFMSTFSRISQNSDRVPWPICH